MIPRRVEIVLGIFIFAFITVSPFLYELHHKRYFRNFRVVEDGVLYRSAQLPVDGLRRYVNDYGIKTIVTLRIGVKDDDKAEDVVVIDLKGKSAFADYMVIATGRSNRQVVAIADHLAEKLKQAGQIGRAHV